MNNQVQNFLALLGGAINKKESLSLNFPIDWREIFKLAQAHNVYALVFEQACEIPAFLETPEYNSYMITATAQVAAQAQRTEAFLELYRAFSEAGLYPIVMKGIVCRQMYGEYCDHRPSSDEDILIKKEEYLSAETVLKEQGYLPERDNVTLKQMEEVQEINFFNGESGLYIELHLNPMGHDNDLRCQMNDCFNRVFGNYCEVNIAGTIIRTMSHTDHFLYLVLHAFRHFTAGGFGIRQVLDILLYEKQYKESLNWDYLKKKLSDLDALLFLSDMIHIGNQHLGFQLPILCAPNCPEDLLDDLMSSGVYGNATQVRRTANQMTSAAVAGREKVGGSSATMLRTIFPGRAQMLNQHPELQQKPWLLPIRWVQRWGRFIQHSRDNDGNLARESMEISKRRIELLKKYKII